MAAAKDTPFPEPAFAEAAVVYAVEHDLFALAARCGARKKGYRLRQLGAEAVADLLAERAAEDPAARKRALSEMLEDLGGAPEALAAEEPAPLRKRLRGVPIPDAAARARWILALLLDPRPEIWPLVSALRRPPQRPPSRARAERRPEADADRLAKDLDRAGRTAAALREERDRTAREVRNLQRVIARETDLRKQAERRAERAYEAARKSADEATEAKEELRRRVQRSAQVADGAASARQWRDLQGRMTELAETNAALRRDYSAARSALRALKDRMAERWTEGKIRERDLRPVDPDEPLVVEPPLERDPRPAAEKVRMPSDPHHWPGGSARFRSFLERIARCEHVTRIMPRSFQHPTRHGVSFVTDEGDLIARVSEGDHAAIVLILTTATHRGQGEHVRREIAPLFAERGL
jgi:hypothetical protein